MITIRLLGGAKKAVGGKTSLELEKSDASILEILQFLQNLAVEPRLLRRENLIIAINGVDSSALSGEDSVAKSGDMVTIVTVVHGGTVRKAKREIVVKGIVPISSGIDPGRFLDEMRDEHRHLSIQIIDADAVFGIEHVHRIAQIAMEAESRNIMLAKKLETELLLRMACTNQVSEAIARAGLKKGKSACIIALSREYRKIRKFGRYLDGQFDVDNSVLDRTAKKKKGLSKMLGISGNCGNDYLLNCLVEKAAIMVR